MNLLQNQLLRKNLDTAHSQQTLLIDKLIACCKEVGSSSVTPRPMTDKLVQPNAERTQRLFTSLREELEKRGTAKFIDGAIGG